MAERAGRRKPHKAALAVLGQLDDPAVRAEFARRQGIDISCVRG